MRRTISRLLLFIIIYAASLRVVYADYVLPYPSAMPGNKVYKITRILDTLKKYWYFGNIAQTKYHLELTDKYLVEAKTLMEYNQYLLGSDALLRSDDEFTKLPGYIRQAKEEKKDISLLKSAVKGASDKHIEVLEALLQIVPNQFTWTPEKAQATDLKLRDMIERSLKIRTQVAAEVSPL